MEHRYIAVLIALDLGAGHAVGPAQAHLAPNRKALKFVWGIFHVIVALDIDFSTERNGSGAIRLILRMISDFNLF